MPILATPKHAKPFIASPQEAIHLADIDKLINTLLGTQINRRVQKMMIDRAVWLVVEHTGNFYSRFRSDETIGKASVKPGVRIQRDHVYTRKSLVAHLLSGTATVSSVIDQAQCCIVTKEEHDRLSRVPQTIVGWDRYRKACPPVGVMNMETGVRVV